MLLQVLSLALVVLFGLVLNSYGCPAREQTRLTELVELAAAAAAAAVGSDVID